MSTNNIWQILKVKSYQFNIIEIVESAIEKTTADYIDLLKRGRSERSFLSHLASCINLKISNIPELKAIPIQCDPFYNKHLTMSKELNNRKVEVDFVIHHRGVDDFNLLVGEIETINVPSRDDVWKLEEMTRLNSKNGYSYKLGLYLVIGIEKKAGEVLHKDWFINGVSVIKIEK